MCETLSYWANDVMFITSPEPVVVVQDSANGGFPQPAMQVIDTGTATSALMAEPFEWPHIAGWSNGAKQEKQERFTSIVEYQVNVWKIVPHMERLLRSSYGVS